MPDQPIAADVDIWPDSAFWRYSLDLYRKDGVEEACLALQERRGVDVNLLLLAFWLGSRGVALDPAKMPEIEETIVDMRTNVVQPLRAVRRHLRKLQREAEPSSLAARWPEPVDQLRSRVAAAELDGEHVIQLALEQASAELKEEHPKGAGLAVANLRNVAVFADADRADLTVLLRQAFGEIAAVDLAHRLRDLGLS